MVTLPSWPGTGMGNSPPARKLAVSPESATRFGSASVRATPFCSSALIIESIVVEPATSGDCAGRDVGGAGRRRDRHPAAAAFRRLARADIGGDAVAENVPLHAEV